MTTGMPIEMGINKKLEIGTTCMGMALIPIGINSHRRMPCLAYVLARKRKILFYVKVEYNSAYISCSL